MLSVEASLAGIAKGRGRNDVPGASVNARLGQIEWRVTPVRRTSLADSAQRSARSPLGLPATMEGFMLTARRPVCGSSPGTTADATSGPTNNARGTRTHQNDELALGSLLVCDGCDQTLQLSWGPNGDRLYVFLCGCRRDGVDARVVERLVRDRVEGESVLLVDGVANEEFRRVFRNLFAEVRVAASADDLVFVWRI
ncbi:hypothetical protein [Dactylosporangium sp. NPDC005555]|uniref:hypothetical protein n=1 Tax=Dactylosporangium sp. NPDC005555 TaxID=3154889 RepID=UPI0033AB9625